MPESPHYNWPKIPLGDRDYPETHSELVDEIDDELYRVENRVVGGGDRTLVTSTEELEFAFNNLSPGDTIIIADDNAPYRTTQYLDIDRDDVTVRGRGRFPLVMPADGSNVGGIRIGKHNRASRVTIDGFSYDGNPDGQTASTGGFGIGSWAANSLTIKNCDIRRTWPYHRHNQQNSGISIYEATNGYTIWNNHIEDIGDRAIEAAGDFGYVVGNTSVNGFDRTVALEANRPDGSENDAYGLVVHGNILKGGNAQGSFLGGGGTGREMGVLIVTSNFAEGGYRRFVRCPGLTDQTEILVANNIAMGPSPSEGVEIWHDTTHVYNNFIKNHLRGVTVQAPGSVVMGNKIKGCRQEAIHVKPDDGNQPNTRNGGQQSTISGNIIERNASDAGEDAEIRVDANRVRVTNNQFLRMRDGVVCFDDIGGSDSVYMNNIAPVGQTLFGAKQASSVDINNIN